MTPGEVEQGERDWRIHKRTFIVFSSFSFRWCRRVQAVEVALESIHMSGPEPTGTERASATSCSGSGFNR